MPHRGGTDLKPKVVAALVFSLLTAVAAGAFWGEFRHVPERRPEWISTKPHLERGLMGAVAYTAHTLRPGRASIEHRGLEWFPGSHL